MNPYLKTFCALCAVLLALNCAGETAPEQTPRPTTGETAPSSSVKDLSKPLTVPASIIESGLILTEGAAPTEHVPRTLRTSARVESALGGSLSVKAPSDARVIQLFVTPGSTVTKGQQLASLEVPAIAQARAAVRRSRSVAEGAQRLVLQEQELERVNATSERSRIAAEQNLALAKAEQLASQAELRAWSATVEGGTGIVTLRAPMAGIATQIEVQTGEFIAAGTTLLRVLDPDAWEIRALVPEASALSVAVGAAQVEISSSHSCEGQVLGHQHRVEPGLGVVPFRILPSASCAAFLLEGASLQVLMPLRSKADDANRISVPRDSITEIGERKVLFIQGTSPEELSVVELSSVEFWGDRAYVLGALSGGARVVSKGVLLLKGELVRADLE